MTPSQQRRTSAARDSTPIRTFSPYSEAEGPIVGRGFVEAHVRAIEGDFKQLWVPPSSEPREIHHLPEWRLKGLQHHSPPAPSTASRPFGKVGNPFIDVSDGGPEHGLPRQRKSLQQLPSIGSRWQHSPSRDRKSQSLANIRALYGDSPLQGRAGQRSRSIGQRTSLEPTILSPQPLSPSRLFMSTEDDYQDDADFWTEVHPRALTSIPEAPLPEAMATPNKSIAERMSDMVSEHPVPESTEPSTDWGSESNILEHPLQLPSRLEEQPATGTLHWSTVANQTDESANDLQVKRVRPSRIVPNNTVDSSKVMYLTDKQQNPPQVDESPYLLGEQDIQPLSKAQRSLTMHLPRRTRTASVASWRAKLRSMSFDQLADKRNSAAVNIAAHEPEPNIKPEASSSKPMAIEEEKGVSQSIALPSRSRHASSTSINGSMSGSRALRRAWRKWSGWRLVLGDKSSHDIEPPGAFPINRSGSSNNPGLKEEGVDHEGGDPSTAPTEDKKHIQRPATPVHDDVRTDLQSPPPQTPKRPISLLRDSSKNSISPIAARPTTALSPTEIPGWRPSMSQASRSNTISSRPSLPSIKQSSHSQTNPFLHHTQSAAPLATSSELGHLSDHGSQNCYDRPNAALHHKRSAALVASSFQAAQPEDHSQKTSNNRSNPSLHHMRSAASISNRPPAAQRLPEPACEYSPYSQLPSSNASHASGHHQATQQIPKTDHKDSTSSDSTSTIYHSLYPTHKNSHSSMRSPWRDQHEKEHWQAEIPLRSLTPSSSSRSNERDRDRGRTRERGGAKQREKQGSSREQRIKRVKVVVSLDGTGDLRVNARVGRRQEGDERGRVRRWVRRWEMLREEVE